MSDLPMTEWIPCSMPPVRDGWYDVERRLHGRTFKEKERVRFSEGQWDFLACESKIAVWVSSDFWRGVAVDPETLK